MSSGDRHPFVSQRPGELVGALRERLAGVDDAAGVPLRLDLGRALHSQGRHQEAAAELEALLARPDLPSAAALEAQAVLAGTLVILGRLTEGRHAAEAVLSSVGADAESRAFALSATRAILFFEGRYEAAAERAREGVALAADAGPAARAEARLDLGGMLMHADRFDEAESCLELEPDAGLLQREEAAEILAFIDLAVGRWDRLLHRLPPPTDDPRPGDHSDQTRRVRPGLRAHAHLYLDHVEQAARELQSAPLFVAVHTTTLVAAARVAEARGDIPGAGRLVERTLAGSAEVGFLPQLRKFGPELVRLSLAAGDRPTAERTADLLSDVATRTAVPSVRAAALCAQGMLDGQVDLLREAVWLFQRGPRAVAQAEAREALGLALLGGGDTTAAVETLRASLNQFARLGAARDQRRVARTLAGLGVRTRGLRPSRQGEIGWPALSSTERTVAGLVAEGLTNAEIADRLVISRRTVESHVSHILTKLHVRSRAGIARLTLQHLEPVPSIGRRATSG